MSQPPIILYTSDTCPHAWMVERLFRDHQIEAEKHNISHDPAARETLIALNGGHASVPTVILPSGERLVEPPLRDLILKLAAADPSLRAKLQHNPS